jgi:hypothetical protein
MSRLFAIGAPFTIKVPKQVRRACFNACNMGNSPNTNMASVANLDSPQDLRDGR